MSEMLGLGGLNGHSHGGSKPGSEPETTLPEYDCPPWLPDVLWAIVNDPSEAPALKLDAMRLLVVLKGWLIPTEPDDVEFSDELIRCARNRQAEYVGALALGEIVDTAAE
jgi:hypothetical protein